MGLHDLAASRLRTLLVEGRIPPGAKLNERELCELLGVSRTPLREAIKLIAAEGLVDLVPNRGAVAVKLTEDDVLSTFEVLSNLEGLSGELAAQRMTEEELAEVKALHFEMLAAYSRNDLSSYYQFNAKIHSAINAMAKNPVLSKIYNEVNARAQTLRFSTNQDGAKWKQAVRDHQQMIEALSCRDSAGLRELLTAHLLKKRDVVLELLRAGKIYPKETAKRLAR